MLDKTLIYSKLVVLFLGSPSTSFHMVSSVCYCRNVNPRDPLNINLRKAFLEYDKDL